MRKLLSALAVVAVSASQTLAMSDSDLRAALEQRFKGDRTGACIAAALIEDGTTATAYFCADPQSQRPYDDHTAFEIGSVTKTMTAALLAELVIRGEVTLADPLAKLLPSGTRVPAYKDRQITIGDVVTHTSALPPLPPQWHFSNPANPYATVTDADLLGGLAETQLLRPPGSRWEYSNFAMMVLSYALARRNGTDYEALLRDHLLVPLGMNNTYVANRPKRVHLAPGHLSNSAPAGPWDFHAEMAGVGGVRATLPDMVRYLEGELGMRDSAIASALEQTQHSVATIDGHAMGMNWMLSTLNGRSIVAHEGGTGGYSAFVAFDRAARRAVVALSDTSLVSIGDFGAFGLNLIDRSVLVGTARTIATADSRLIDTIAGSYRLQGSLGAKLRRKGNALTIQADGQPEFELGYDSAGDFYPLEFDALLRPRRKVDGTYALTWFQSGSALEAQRIDPPPPISTKLVPVEAQLAEFEGNYPLAPTLALRIFKSGGKLFVQGTNQAAREIVFCDTDVFIAESVGAEINFARDAANHVIGLTLKQRGLVLRGIRD